MKKLVVVSIVAAVLLASGAVFGKSATTEHELEIRIPDVLFLRITDGTEGSNASADNPSVMFDFQALENIDTYMDMVNAGGGDLEPTNVNNFGDVIVFANRGAWSVGVSAEDFDFEDNLDLEVTHNGVALGDIKVVRSGTPGTNVSSVAASWDLTTATAIASGTRTQGWNSLGFSGIDYSFTVDGHEAPGTYTTTVTYTITAP